MKSITTSLLVLLFASCTNKQYIDISQEVLYDKVKGGWAGQTLGCTYGGPTEFRYCGIMINDTINIPWSDGEAKKWYDGGGGLYDDIYVDLTFVEAIEKYGLDVSADSMAAVFLKKEYPLCHANQQARYNLLQGLTPPACGHWKNNPHADCLDFQIEADFAGIMSPGMVNSSSDICDRAGHIMSYGDGWYGGVYVAAMYALAYVSNDVNYIVTEALKSIPVQSEFYTCMQDIINWHKQYPNDWKKTWTEIENKWSNEISCPDGVQAPFNIGTPMNCGYIILGLLYGQGDFEKTIDISTRAGQDSDCNPASSGGILGTMLGYSNIPEKYRKALDVVADLPFNHTELSLNKAYDMSYKHTLAMIEKHGGRVKDNSVSILYQEIEPVRLEVSFEGLDVAGKKSLNMSIRDFESVEFEGTGAVLKGMVKGEAPLDYVAEMEVHFNDKLVEVCKLPYMYNHRKHELFFNYEQPKGNYIVTCKWRNPLENADLWITDAIFYTEKK